MDTAGWGVGVFEAEGPAGSACGGSEKNQEGQCDCSRESGEGG